MMKTNKRRILVSVILIIILFVTGYLTHPFTKSKTQKSFIAQIDDAKTFRDEANALALSMPLLQDTILSIISDSLVTTLIQLNNSWIHFVMTEDYEDYYNDIKSLNESMSLLRASYMREREMRIISRSIKKLEENQKHIDKIIKKYST